jgi:hypothetical protein
VSSSHELFDATPRATSKTKFLETQCRLPHPLANETYAYAPVVVPAAAATRNRGEIDDARKHWQRKFQSETLLQQKMEVEAERMKHRAPPSKPMVNAGIRTVGGVVPWASDYVLYQQKNSLSAQNMLGHTMTKTPAAQEQEGIITQANKQGEKQAERYMSRMENVQRTREVHKRVYPQTSQRPF